MADLIIPKSPIQGGAAPTIRVHESNVGSAVAAFGAQIQQVGLRVRDEQDAITMAETRVNMQRDLGQLRQEFDRINDPRIINDQFGNRVAEVRAGVLENLPKRLQQRAALAFDELATRHTLAIGARTTALVRDQQRASLDVLHNSSVETGATADADTRDTLALQFADSVEELVASGAISRQEAVARLTKYTGDASEAAALTQLTSNPAAFIEALNSGDYSGLPAARRATLLARATASVASQEKQAKANTNAIANNQLNRVITAARQGRVAESESDILDTPEFRDNPKYNEALAAVRLRDERPDLARMTPEQLRAEIEAEKGRSVKNGYDNDRLEAMQSILKESEKGWRDDPISRANDVGLVPPAAPEDLATADDQTLVNFFASRAQFGSQLVEDGYIDHPVYFSKDEREQVAKMAGADQDPAARVHLAMTLVSGFGKSANQAMQSLGVDPVFSMMAGEIAGGANPAIAEQAFKGQQAIAAGMVDLPSISEARGLVFDKYANLFEDMGNGQQLKKMLLDTATAIWAGSANGQPADGGDFEESFLQALDLALGAGENARGQKTGGIQEIGNDPRWTIFYSGVKTLMPIGMNADEFNSAWGRSIEQFGQEGGDPLAVWRDASVTGDVPTFAGRNITDKEIANLQFRAVGDGVYQMYYTHNGTWPIEAGNTGRPYLLDMRAFVDGMGQ